MEINSKQTCPTTVMNEVNSFIFPTFLISEKLYSQINPYNSNLVARFCQPYLTNEGPIFYKFLH